MENGKPYKVMTIDFDKKFKSFTGEDTPDSMAATIAQILFNYGHDAPATTEDKLKAYFLSQRIMCNPREVSITSEDASFIKRLCADVLTAGGYGQVYETIENR